MPQRETIKGTKKIVSSDRDFTRKIIFSIFIFVFLIYGNGIRNEYAVDDRYVTVTSKQAPDNLRVAKGIRGIPEIFTSHYVVSDDQSFDYRPLPIAAFAIEYQFLGSNPHMNHFFNVLIYALTCALLYVVLLQILKNYSGILPLIITFLFIA